MTGPEPLTGEPLALDLLNTLPYAAGGEPYDHLADAGRLRAWLALEADRLPRAAGEHTADAADAAALRALRSCAARALAAARRGERPDAADLDALNEAQRAAPAVRFAEWDGGTVTAEPRRSGPLGTRLAAALAEEVVLLLADPAVRDVRECEADDCTMLFLPAHPRRRWCSAARCGNRARVARYYARHKEDRPG
ncbi:CGNR zinc finger domain-containing protein [Streptomyces sp. NBC_00525]|uniref:CGNR zinc finger domain-containing protein n=1 Tax=Streptomyces sp. NBC_00525 TaxID=2903660 RepID=UPI002E8231B6|nr:ABATE domain-containing protein [Streptomyces sp. NBC_00525]WUC96906.1 ABATE domain-containing protein [Streptomyces sp. NBC_00525]